MRCKTEVIAVEIGIGVNEVYGFEVQEVVD